MNKTTKVLEAKDLSLSWDSEPVVDSVSLEVGAGEIVCLLGRSGIGKTTLFHALAGLSRPDRGQVFIESQDRTAQPGFASYMLQKDLLLPHLSVIDNCALPLVIKGSQKNFARVQAADLLRRFDLSQTAQLWPHQLSGGMRQRIALLRTYLMDNRVVLLDEPFSALDAMTRIDMRDWFIETVDELGLSALVITHDIDEALSIANRIYVLARPRPTEAATIIAEEMGRPADFRGRFELTEDFLLAKQRLLEHLA